MNYPIVDQAGPVPVETLKDEIDQVLKTLTYREREIIKLRYGLGDDYRYTRKEVGRIFKTLPHYIQKVEKRAFRKLQHPIRSRKLEAFLDTLAAEDLSTPEGRLLQKVFGVSAARWPLSFFNFATSERCQDAFISWLIAWAHHDHREVNEPLHRTGAEFLKRLLRLHGVEPPAEYTDLKIRKYKRIDILVEVNRAIVVLIEDKVDFSEQPGQLERYLRIVRKDFKELTPVPVYLKTGDQLDCTAIENAGWKCFFRHHLLEVLEFGKQEGVESDIFRDFHSRLRQMEADARRRNSRGFYRSR
jgi:DNA-binding CsgD family transcriptional regulator